MENDDNFGLDPGAFYRWSRGFDLFGLRHTQLCEAAKTGKIPPTMESAAGGKARGWVGTQIIEHRRARLAEAQERARLAAAKAAAKAAKRALKGKQSATAE
jgi:hypothetical protein